VTLYTEEQLQAMTRDERLQVYANLVSACGSQIWAIARNSPLAGSEEVTPFILYLQTQLEIRKAKRSVRQLVKDFINRTLG